MGNAMVSEAWAGREWAWLVRPTDGRWTPLRLVWSAVWTYYVLRFVIEWIVLKPWGSVAESKRAIARNEVKRQQGFEEFKKRVDTSDAEVIARRTQITEWSFEELRQALQKDELTAVQALEAYVWKGMQVQDRINCMMSVISEAWEWAAATDALHSKKPEKPALYGMPFSVKGNFYVAGYDCTIGSGKLLEQPVKEHNSMVSHLRSLGAVPFCITNVPQGLLSFVCANAVYGCTSNPHDLERTPGGSSGGEGAIVAAGGSSFGTGSDLAGSLRIPAAMCGLVTIKPTQGRLTVTNAHGGVPGRGRLGLSYGFFTKTVEEQLVLVRNTWGSERYRDLCPETIPTKFDEQAFSDTSRLKIGYFVDDGFLTPVPAMSRPVLDTVEKLRAAGHEMVKFTVPDPHKMARLSYKNVMPDGGAFTRGMYAGDAVHPHLSQFVTLLGVPKWLRTLASYLLHPISPQMALVSGAYVEGLEDLRSTQEKTDDYKMEFIAYWKSLGIDALVCPSFPVPSVPHSYPSQLGMCATYTILFNLLDIPSGCVPAGKITKEDDEAVMDEDKFPCGRNLAYKTMRAASANSAGLPTSVQIATLCFEEEKCLRVMSEVEQLWKD